MKLGTQSVPDRPSSYYAHSAEGLPEGKWQPLKDHLLAVAGRARHSAEKFGAADLGYVAGLLHDLGKYTSDFQHRLRGGQRVDHATAGAQEVVAAYANERIAAELLAYAIAGHHAGLADREGLGEASLNARLAKSVEAPDEVWRLELGPLPERIFPKRLSPHGDLKHQAFQLAMLGRFVFSSLVDADYLDTEIFYANLPGAAPRERDLPSDLKVLRSRLEDWSAVRQVKDSSVNELRAEILAHARAKAVEAPGLFSLNVPTGGGKTLTSLAFAFDHAIEHGLDRVIYAIPYTSIIDQTAQTFRAILGDEAVLEHHSAIEQDKVTGLAARDKLRLAMENWAAPVVVTTNVQLFESLFSDRPSRCRKLHNLAKAVIVLDEVQTLPRPVLRPCVAAIGELARNYGSSIVLCTATQPAFEKQRTGEEAEPKWGLEGVRELAKDPKELHRRLTRVSYVRAGEMSDEALLGALEAAPRGLIIVNTRKHALTLYRAARDAGLDGLIHLSTRMVAAHRRPLIDRIHSDLEGEKPTRVIATSLVEAGVDLDFPAVWRAEAGLDQILQAGGRCNREGKRSRDDSIVTVFRPADPKDRGARDVQALAGVTDRRWEEWNGSNMFDAIRDYFEEVYWQQGDDALDRHGVLAAFKADSESGTGFNYRTVGQTFRLIEETMTSVVVPFDDRARAAIAALPHAERIGGLARTLQPYTVQIPKRDRAALLASGEVQFADREQQFAVLQQESLYREDEGLVWEEAGTLPLQSYIV